MGLYIKGLDMPIVCADCYCCISEPDTMPRCALTHGSMCVMECNNQRLADCPLVEVKEPHGDLIDRDAFLEDMNCGLWDWSTVDGITATTALKQTMSDLRNAPTVIEAEGQR